ncbi:MAG TPA: hypothetical protein VFJ06_11805 [Halococcus sp.]|nr:hypothetical protein [Halococcus sp.]
MNHSVAFWAKKWAQYAYEETRKNGLRGAREGVVRPWRDVFRAANQQVVRTIGNPGRPIYEPNWDVLVILDACRADLMEEIADEYSFVTDIGRFRSRGSKTPDWMARNFTADYAEEMAQTAYIAGNPFSRRLDGAEFAVLDEVWQYAWDESVRTIPARPVTDRAIDTWRRRDEYGAEQMIIHYMQPHGPFVAAPELGGDLTKAEEFGRGRGTLWDQAGYTIPRERVWWAYRENLRHVLDDLEVLLENLDADRVVISADHGNAVGEFGMWGHPDDVLLPCLRQVPWVETSATDEQTYEPSLEQSHEDAASTDDAVRARLRDLGYTE